MAGVALKIEGISKDALNFQPISEDAPNFGPISDGLLNFQETSYTDSLGRLWRYGTARMAGGGGMVIWYGKRKGTHRKFLQVPDFLGGDEEI